MEMIGLLIVCVTLHGAISDANNLRGKGTIPIDDVKDYIKEYLSEFAEQQKNVIDKLKNTIYSQEMQIAELQKENLAHKRIASKLEARIVILEAIREEEPSKNRDELSKRNPKYGVESKADSQSSVAETSTNRVAEPKPFRRIRRSAVDYEVAFSATMSSNQEHLGVNQDMLFDHVITSVGNGYNSHHGTFVAPVSGTYVFYFSLHSPGGRADLVVNGVPKANLYIGNDQASQLVIVNLKTGDDVSVQNINADKLYWGSGYSTFSGFLLYQGTDPTQIVG